MLSLLLRLRSTIISCEILSAFKTSCLCVELKVVCTASRRTSPFTKKSNYQFLCSKLSKAAVAGRNMTRTGNSMLASFWKVSTPFLAVAQWPNFG